MVEQIDKYKIIEEIEFENRTLYKSLNPLNNQEIFIELHKTIDGSDWNLGAKINDELRKLKLSFIIIEYFYTTNPQTKEKIFYKVFDEHPSKKENTDIPLSKEEEENIKYEEERYMRISRRKRTRSKRIIEEDKAETILVCARCKTEVNLRKVNPTREKAFCKVCNRERPIELAKKKKLKKKDVKKPTLFKVEKDEEKLLIEISENKVTVLSLIVTGVLFISVIFSDLGARSPGYSGKSGIFDLIPPGSPLRMLLGYLAIGALIVLVVKLLDKKYIEVSKAILLTYTKPYSISKPKEYRSKKISQLYVKKELKGETYSKYNLMAMLKTGDEVSLFETVNGKDATYLENLIEDYLDIDDVKVKGELEY